MPRAAGRWDVAVAGGGIVGLATAHALAARGRSVVVLEAEDLLATHQSARNSGVVHSGLYYRPGSLKARLCAEGRAALEDFCAAEGVAFERCGKLVVASDAREAARLDELERRGRALGLAGLARVGPEGIRAREPHAAGVAGLLVPETGIVDFPGVCAALARRIMAAGGAVETSAAVRGARTEAGALVVETARGPWRARLLVACAGLQADRVARRCGCDPGVTIAPFRGEYRLLREDRRALVRHLIYPVPDPRFPFLGVHLTRRVGGEVEAGPNAVLALARAGYRARDLSLRDTAELIAWPGFARMVAALGARGVAEAWRAASAAAFVRDLRRLVPALEAADLAPARAGVRAQALGRDGALLDDFHVVEAARQIHVLNAPSPAATASLAIGRWIAERAIARLE
uniref:L-2-hydroxyglutarate oxidase n=1 Tax=Eiseniibacteriota bacterium TaxID=2212470 RepID=A0A832I2Q0_UNCEI